MPPPQIFSLDGHAFGLTVSGVQIIDKVPTDLAPIRWDWPSPTTSGGISFTIEDEGETALPAGAVVRFTDNASNDLLSETVLTGIREARGAGPYRRVDVTGTGWGFYLDHVHVLDFEYGYENWIRGGVERLLNTTPGPISRDVSSVANNTSGILANGTADKTTIRGALDQMIGETGLFSAYYVDNDRKLHMYETNEANDAGTAPSVGATGDVAVEYLSIDRDHTSVAHFAHAYGTATSFGNIGGYASAWDFPVSSVFENTGSDTYTDILAGAVDYLFYVAADIVELSFTSVELSGAYNGWRPGQEVTLDDDALGTATHYIAAVSAMVDDRNVIEFTVSSKPPRSFVQDVVSGNVGTNYNSGREFTTAV